MNLASYLRIDAYLSDCDVAVIVSNDSDLVFPIEHIKKYLCKMIGIAPVPQPRTLCSRHVLQGDSPEGSCLKPFRP